MQPTPDSTAKPPTVLPEDFQRNGAVAVPRPGKVFRPVWPQLLGALLILHAIYVVLTVLAYIGGIIGNQISPGWMYFGRTGTGFIDWVTMLPFSIPFLDRVQAGALLESNLGQVSCVWTVLLLFSVWQFRFGRKFYGEKKLRPFELRLWLLLSIVASFFYVWMLMVINDHDRMAHNYYGPTLYDILEPIAYWLQGFFSSTQWSSNGPWNLADQQIALFIKLLIGCIWPQLLVCFFLIFPKVRGQMRQWGCVDQ